MSTPDPNRRPSAAGRYLFLLLLGLVVGAIGAVMAMRAWDQRRDHVPDALMTLQAWHMGKLKASREQNRCAATDVIPHLQALRSTANDLEAGFGKLADDERFVKHASDFRAKLDAAIQQPPLSCESLGATMKGVGEGCESCHKDFKG